MANYVLSEYKNEIQEQIIDGYREKNHMSINSLHSYYAIALAKKISLYTNRGNEEATSKVMDELCKLQQNKLRI